MGRRRVEAFQRGQRVRPRADRIEIGLIIALVEDQLLEDGVLNDLRLHRDADLREEGDHRLEDRLAIAFIVGGGHLDGEAVLIARFLQELLRLRRIGRIAFERRVIGGRARGQPAIGEIGLVLDEPLDDEVGIDRIVDRLPDALVLERLEFRIEAHMPRLGFGHFEEVLRQRWIGRIGRVLGGAQDRCIDLFSTKGDFPRRGFAHDLIDDPVGMGQAGLVGLREALGDDARARDIFDEFEGPSPIGATAKDAPFSTSSRGRMAVTPAKK